MKRLIVLLLAIAVWIISNLSIGLLLGKYNYDLTKAQYYTLNKTSRDLAQNISKPLIFRLYISTNLSSYSLESYRHAHYATALLSQYQSLNNKFINLEISRLKPYTAEAQLAEKNGIKAIPHNNEYAYFGLEVITDNQRKVISELIPQRQSYFENDINRILRNLQINQKPIIGIMSPEIPLFEKNQKQQIWSLIDEMKNNYKLMNVTKNASYIPQTIKALVVLNPYILPQSSLYALEQYLLAGGKLIIFVDPYSEITQLYYGYPPHGKTSLGDILFNWGIRYNNDYVVGNMETALQTTEGADYPIWFMTSGNQYKKLSFHSAGSFSISPIDGLDYQILITTPKNSGSVSTEYLRYFSKKDTVKHFQNNNKTYNLAIKVSGNFLSAHDENNTFNEQNNSPLPFLPIAADGAQLIIIADSDFASDEAWVLSSDEKNPIYGSAPYADNAEFILSLIDNSITDDNFPLANVYPKYFDETNITQAVSTPLITAFQQQKLDIEKQYHETIEKLQDIEYQNINEDIDTGKRLQYKQQTEMLKNQINDYRNRLDRLNSLLIHRIELSVQKIMLINAVICPFIIILIFFLIINVLRKNNVKRLR